jgi:hypothetical protein
LHVESGRWHEAVLHTARRADEQDLGTEIFFELLRNGERRDDMPPGPPAS